MNPVNNNCNQQNQPSTDHHSQPDLQCVIRELVETKNLQACFSEFSQQVPFVSFPHLKDQLTLCMLDYQKQESVSMEDAKKLWFIAELLTMDGKYDVADQFVETYFPNNSIYYFFIKARIVQARANSDSAADPLPADKMQEVVQLFKQAEKCTPSNDLEKALLISSYMALSSFDPENKRSHLEKAADLGCVEAKIYLGQLKGISLPYFDANSPPSPKTHPFICKENTDELIYQGYGKHAQELTQQKQWEQALPFWEKSFSHLSTEEQNTYSLHYTNTLYQVGIQTLQKRVEQDKSSRCRMWFYHKTHSPKALDNGPYTDLYKASQREHTEAMIACGRLCWRKSPKEAVSHWKKVLEKNVKHPEANFYLAIAHSLGRGVKKDEGQAKNHFTIAKQEGHPQAQKALVYLESKNVADLDFQKNVQNPLDPLEFSDREYTDFIAAQKPLSDRVLHWIRNHTPEIATYTRMALQTIAIIGIIVGSVAGSIALLPIFPPLGVLVLFASGLSFFLFLLLPGNPRKEEYFLFQTLNRVSPTKSERVTPKRDPRGFTQDSRGQVRDSRGFIVGPLQ